MYPSKNKLESQIKNLALTALSGLALLWPMSNANAQVCGNALAASPTISPISGSQVVVGQTVTITKVFFGSSDPANCLFRNGEGFLLYPNGTVVRVVTNLDLNPPGVPPFNSFLNCFGTNSVQPEGTVFAFTTNYVVSAADVGKSNAIVLPVRGQLTAPQTIPFPGGANVITFGAAGDTDGFNPGSPTSPTGVATGSGSQFLTVVSPGLTVTKVCDSECFQYGAPITFHGTVCNTGDVELVNVVVSNTLAGSATVLVTNFPILPAGACSNYVGIEIPVGNLCGPFTNTVTASGVAASVFQTPSYFATNSAVCTVCMNPCVNITKTCTTAVVGTPEIVSGVVSNCGNLPLTNIAVSDSVLGPITNILSLPVGSNFLYSVIFTPTTCGTTTNVVTASGLSVCGATVTDSATNTCTVTQNPCIQVTKNCTQAVVGQTQIVSGAVTNCGNVTLTNVTVTDNVLGLVARITSLAPGSNVLYSTNYTATVCGTNLDYVVAAGISPCGSTATFFATNDCVVTQNPCIQVSSTCLSAVVGGTNIMTGTVTNCGNVTLTNVTVSDSLAGTIISGITLAPLTATNFSHSFTAVCGGNTNIVTASGISPCGTTAAATSTNVCPVTQVPCIQVTKNCTQAVVGQTQIVSGAVTNCGNVTLTNVTVSDNVLGLLATFTSLAPGSNVLYSSNYIATVCGTNFDYVTASGISPCGSTATFFATNDCVVTQNPCIQVSSTCSSAVVGGTNIMTGTVTNCGNVTLTNVTVSDSLDGTMINGITLAPGTSTNFSHSFTAVCGGNTNIVTASGISPCGTTTSATSTNVCPVTQVPCIQVTKNCTQAVVGQTQIVSGAVTNCGTVTLTNVTVTDNVLGLVASITSLAPGSNVLYSTNYIATVCGTNLDYVTASGISPCGSTATFFATNDCVVTQNPCIQVSSACSSAIVGGSNLMTGTVTNCGNVTLTNVTVTDSLDGTMINGITLAPGTATNFSHLFLAVCGGNTNVVTASGISPCLTTVTASSTNTCPVNLNPCLTVTKNCTQAIVGQTQIVSGVVSNCGNVTITNVTVTDNVLGLVASITSLAPGSNVLYSTNYTATVCGTNLDYVAAAGFGPCGPTSTALATNDCVVTQNPCIQVSSTCSSAVVGGSNLMTGTVTNCGNVTLTNVTVTDSLDGTMINGITLAPGTATNFSHLFLAVCGGNTNVVTASGISPCLTTVTASSTNTCPVNLNPCITVTKNCTQAVVGQPQIVSGVVSNCGNVTITNVTVTDNVLGLVASITSLAPGSNVLYSTNYTATVCGTNLDYVAAAGFGPCGPTSTAFATNDCVVTQNPCIAVTSVCSSAIVGGTNVVTGTVTNCGNVTLTNVTVTDSLDGTITAGITLAPGTATNFSHSFTAVCGGNTNVVTASGISPCGTTAIAHSTNTCPVIQVACITVTKNCSQAFIGGSQIVSGVVSNCGNVTLTNVTVSDNVLGLVATITSLAPGSNVLYSTNYTVTTCGTNIDYVTASGMSPCGTTATSFATNNCVVTENPCISVTKTCSLADAPGQTQTVSGTVTNCGNVTLTNISVTDNILGIITNINSLAPNTGTAYTKSFTATACGTNADYVTASGTSTCGTTVSSHATNNCVVICPPNVGITKLVACYLGSNNCGTFSTNAVGVRSDTTDPAFCYEITITNPGPVDLTNVSVVDTNPASGTGFGDLTTNFPCITNGVLRVGDSCTYMFKAEVGKDLTNIVNIIGYSIVTGQPASATNSATVEVLPASVSCVKQYSIDGGPLTNNAVLADSNLHTNVYYVTIFNQSADVNLVNVMVSDLTSNLGCDVVLPPFYLGAGSNVTFAICTNTFACTNGAESITNTVGVVADQFTVGISNAPACALDINGSNILVSSECDAVLSCTAPGACRVTGGGRQDAPEVFPADVRYVTHGGQVGAPTGDAICIVTADFPLGNPCIHGRWTHVRHMQGGNEGNFHARFYDTLQCACLDTTLTPAVTNFAGVDGASGQTYTNLYYGPGTLFDTVCNPGNRLAGPEPSPAPANKMVFTGVGDYALTEGERVPVSVLFRVDIEDRGEPGGSHPIGSGKGGSKTGRIPDRNRTRIWILTQQELAELRGAGPDPLLLKFRNAISACNGINVQDGASVPNGTPVFGVRQPDIDDGGEVNRGNYQIHPSIMNCNPANPTGPGLAKP